MEDLNNLFDRCNEKYFDNSLEKIDVIYNGRLKRTLARYKYSYIVNERGEKIIKNKPVIEVSKNYAQAYPDQLINVLVHEMIHHKYPFDNHSKRFKNEMERLNKNFKELKIEVRSNQALKADYSYRCSNANCPNYHKRIERYRKMTGKHRCSACLSPIEEVVKKN